MRTRISWSLALSLCLAACQGGNLAGRPAPAKPTLRNPAAGAAAANKAGLIGMDGATLIGLDGAT
ncbi:MAG: hypothetical protein VKP62_04915, partial [Candidatus Sericytochromatia bacterium]|nr:hypothetical protein [Candidatus Sericytochromatia bacterium]MEB3196526.1 hypothetical protein [Candidatus Sericytochromatia bacterium]